MEIYFDSVRLYSSLIPKKFVRNYWYIEPSPENSPRLVLLRLHEPITLTPNIQPIRLPSSENFPYEDWSSYVLGFQLTSGSVMAHLRSTHASILNNNLCNFHGIIHDHEMCASDGSPGLDGTEGSAFIIQLSASVNSQLFIRWSLDSVRIYSWVWVHSSCSWNTQIPQSNNVICSRIQGVSFCGMDWNASAGTLVN